VSRQLKEQLKERIRERIEKRLQRAKAEKQLIDFNTRANSYQILDCINAFAEEGHIIKAADKVFELHKDDPQIAETRDEIVAGIYGMVGQFPVEVSILQDFYHMVAGNTDPYEIVASMELRLLQGQ
jgi:hypothetical protein